MIATPVILSRTVPAWRDPALILIDQLKAISLSVPRKTRGVVVGVGDRSRHLFR